MEPTVLITPQQQLTQFVSAVNNNLTTYYPQQSLLPVPQ